MKHFQPNPISSGSADGTKHAVQVHVPENPSVSDQLDYKRNNEEKQIFRDTSVKLSRKVLTKIIESRIKTSFVSKQYSKYRELYFKQDSTLPTSLPF